MVKAKRLKVKIIGQFGRTFVVIDDKKQKFWMKLAEKGNGVHAEWLR